MNQIIGFFVTLAIVSVSAAAEPTGNRVGSINRKELRAEILKHQEEVKSCYFEALKIKPNIKGTLTLGWEINVLGKAGAVKVLKSIDPNVDICVSELLKEWNFPAPPNGRFAMVKYPWVFNADKE